METGHQEINSIIGLITKNQTDEANQRIKSLKKRKIENGQKIQGIASVTMVLEGKRDPGAAALDLLLLRSFKGYKINKKQRQSLINLKKALESIKSSTEDCPHPPEKLEIYRLMHGGGFTPTVVIPELVCRECGLNVTLPAFQKRWNGEAKPFDEPTHSQIEERYGIQVMGKFIKNLKEYMEDTNAGTMGVENILKNPEGVFAEVKKMPSMEGFIINDKKKLDSFSGK